MVSGGLNRFFSGYSNALCCRLPGSRVILGGELGATSIERVFRCFARGLGSSVPEVIDSHFSMYGLPFYAGSILRWKCQSLVRRLLRRESVARPLLLVHFHGPWGQESQASTGHGSRLAGLKSTFDRTMLKRAQAVVVLSAAFQGLAVELGADPQRVRRIGPGLDTEWFSDRLRTGSTSKSDLQVLCVRRLNARMGHRELIETLSKLGFVANSKTIKLNLVGTGEEEASLRRLVARLGIESKVVFHGRVSDQAIRDLALQCSVSVVPTVSLEGFGLVVIEAMAMGLPVISTGQGGLSEAMGPWARPPFLFDVRSPSELERAVTAADELHQDTREVDRLREYAMTFSWENVLSETLADIR